MRVLGMLLIASSIPFSATLAWRGALTYGNGARGEGRSRGRAIWGLSAQLVGTVGGALALAALVVLLDGGTDAGMHAPGLLGGGLLLAFAGALAGQKWIIPRSTSHGPGARGTLESTSATGRTLVSRAAIGGVLMLIGFSVL